MRESVCEVMPPSAGAVTLDEHGDGTRPAPRQRIVEILRHMS
jgi:hypothetical protein